MADGVSYFSLKMKVVEKMWMFFCHNIVYIYRCCLNTRKYYLELIEKKKFLLVEKRETMIRGVLHMQYSLLLGM